MFSYGNHRGDVNTIWLPKEIIMAMSKTKCVYMKLIMAMSETMRFHNGLIIIVVGLPRRVAISVSFR